MEEYRRNSAEKRRLGMLDAWATGGSAALAQYLELALQALVLVCPIVPWRTSTCLITTTPSPSGV